MSGSATHPTPGTVYACPECDVASLKFRQLTRDYRCNICKNVCETPVERPESPRGPKPRFHELELEDVGLKPLLGGFDD